MNFKDWYTDTVDIYRVSQTVNAGLIRNERRKEPVLQGIPCRVYQSHDKTIKMEQTASSIYQESKLACDNSVKILAGDELLIHRGGVIGQEVDTIRAFASEPHYYFDPFGGIISGLSHQEIVLLQQERVK